MSESKHTPGPWRWEINLASKSLHLVGGAPKFDLTVMDFKRWGMGGSTARLRDLSEDGMNIMHKVHERPDWIAPFEGREHHADWCADITHPDMVLIARAPDLAAEVERRRAEAASFHMDYRMKCDEETKRLAVEVEGLRATLDAERRKVEALRSASVGSRGWLVEWRYHGSVQWLYLWSAACGGFLVTPDASEALRLARREDAEAVLEWARDTDSRRGLHSGTFLVTEHVWESAALASTEGGA